MKISGATIRNISIYTETDFSATYKGFRINITTNHGHGRADYSHLKRFDITVTNLKNQMKDVDAVKDFHEFEDAIRYALWGAMLLPSQNK